MKVSQVSVTLLSSYLYCPRKLFLQQVLDVEEPPKEALVRGTVRHETYDIINRSEEAIVLEIKKSYPDEEIRRIYNDAYSKILINTIMNNKKRLEEVNLIPTELFREVWKLIKDEAETRSSKIISFRKKYDLHGQELWDSLTPKIETEIRINSINLKLKGIIDRIEKHKLNNEESIVPFELKTGKAPREGVWPNHKIQVGAYAMLLEEKFSTRISKGFVHYLDTKEIRQVSINPFLRAQINETTDLVIETLNSMEIPDFVDSREKCVKCSLKNLCYDKNKVSKIMQEVLVNS